MRLPTVTHPTDRPNFCEVELGEISIYFSYQTPIAFWSRQTGRVVRENRWGPTTGKHINYVDNGRQGERVDSETFERQLAMVMDSQSNPHTIEEMPV